MHQPQKNYNIKAKKSLGQHFLNSSIVPEWLCDASELHEGINVLEIGPGTGVLTEALLKKKASVLAVETDKRSVDILKERFLDEVKEEQLHILEYDIRNGIPNHVRIKDRSYQVVANIPYYLTGLIIRTFLETPTQPTRMTLLIQKEVAKRIVQNNKSSLLKVAIEVFGTPHYIKTVTRGHFTPAPNVDSAILDIQNITHEKLPIANREGFFQLLRGGFSHPRKQLKGNLRNIYEEEKIKNAFKILSLSDNVRAENLSTEKWLQLQKNIV